MEELGVNKGKNNTIDSDNAGTDGGSKNENIIL